MLTHAEAVARADDLIALAQSCYSGPLSVEAVLQQLGTIDQINVDENLTRFRTAWGRRSWKGLRTRSSALLEAAQGVREAIRDFAEL